MAKYSPFIDLSRLIEYYGVTFDHLVPADDDSPEILQINAIEVEDDKGVYATAWRLFTVDPTEFHWEAGTRSAEMLPEETGGHKIAGE